MKKSFIYYFLLLCIILGGCGKSQGEQQAYQVYYLDRNENHIVSQEYEVAADPQDVETVVEELLWRLSTPADKVDYRPAIKGFEVLGFQILEKQITLNFSTEYRELEPIQEVLTRAAIVKTLTQLEKITYVTIQINGENLLDRGGETVGVMTADSFIDNTGEDMKNYEETEVSLYFANAAGDQLIKVNRRLMYNTNIAREKLVVDQLIKGPLKQNKGENSTTFPVLNPQTQILSVNVKDRICYVNLDNSFLTTPYGVSADVVIYSLVNSLTELPGILKVQIAVEGETKIKYQEKYDLSIPFEANPAIIQNLNEEEQ